MAFPSAYLFKPVHPSTVAEKRRRGRCICYGCRRKAETAQRKYRCHTCQARLKRLKHDDRYAFENLKSSARKRGIKFKLTFDQFLAFCEDTGYLALRGREPHLYTIDRRFTDRPYEVGNLRLMTHADNSSHRHEEYADASAAADF